MSLLSPEFRVSLLPDRAGVAARGRAPQARESAEGGLHALDELLAETKPRGRARVTLSHHHARLFLVPAPTVWLREREMKPWLIAQLAEPLGAEAANHWRLTWDLTPPGRPILVAALENSVLDNLSATLGRHGLSLAGARPWLATAWNKRRQLARANGWYALLEPGRMTLLRLQRGQPVSLRQRQTGADTSGEAGGNIAADLRSLLARESLLAGVADAGDLWLERAGVVSDWSGLRGSHTVRELAGPSDPALALLA